MMSTEERKILFKLVNVIEKMSKLHTLFDSRITKLEKRK